MGEFSPTISIILSVEGQHDGFPRPAGSATDLSVTYWSDLPPAAATMSTDQLCVTVAFPLAGFLSALPISYREMRCPKEKLQPDDDHFHYLTIRVNDTNPILKIKEISYKPCNLNDEITT